MPKDTFMAGFDLSEYDDADFGITAVSEAELEANNATKRAQETANVVDVQLIHRQLDTILASIEGAKKINELNSVEQRKNDENGIDETITDLRQEWRSDLLALEKLSLPLLVNLLKSPDKAYIRWDNRVPIIESQMARILEITRRFEE